MTTVIQGKFYKSSQYKNKTKYTFIISNNDENVNYDYHEDTYKKISKLYQIIKTSDYKNKGILYKKPDNGSFFINLSQSYNLQDEQIDSLVRYNNYRIEIQIFEYDDYLCLKIIDINTLNNQKKERKIITL